MLNKKILLRAVAISLFAISGVINFNTLNGPKPISNEEALAEANQSARVTEESIANETAAADSQEVKQPVTKFILAVANPDKPAPTTEDSRAALQLVTSALRQRIESEFGNDPSRLLGVTRPASFKIGEPVDNSGSTAVSVAFKLRDGAPDATVTFLTQKRGGTWLISDIQKSS